MQPGFSKVWELSYKYIQTKNVNYSFKHKPLKIKFKYENWAYNKFFFFCMLWQRHMRFFSFLKCNKQNTVILDKSYILDFVDLNIKLKKIISLIKCSLVNLLAKNLFNSMQCKKKYF